MNYSYLNYDWIIIRRMKRKQKWETYRKINNRVGYFFIYPLTLQRNWVFVTNSEFIIPNSSEPNVVNLWYFKLILFDLTEFIVWNIKGLWHWNPKILGLEKQSLWQWLNSFVKICKYVGLSIQPCISTFLLIQKHVSSTVEIISNFLTSTPL